MTTMYDRAKWHYGGQFPSDRPISQAYVHIGMYLTWIALRGMADDTFFGRTLDGPRSPRAREVSEAHGVLPPRLAR